MFNFKKFNFGNFFDELLINSGQYLLFYIVLNLTIEKFGFFTRIDNYFLVVSLLIQTYFLSIYGKKINFRFFLSFLTPFIYFLLELKEGIAVLLDMSHVFLIIFTLLFVFIQIYLIKYSKNNFKRYFLEYFRIFLNILIFVFLYFFVDLKVKFLNLLNSNVITKSVYENNLQFNHLLSNFQFFIQDPAHLYILISGFILAITMARNKIALIKLKDKLNETFGRFVDNRIRDEILSKGKNYSRKRNAVILFSDIRGFSKISEKNTPKKVIKMLNFYLGHWNETVHQHNGIVDKYIGDAIMVVFTSENKKIITSNAVKSSIKMLNSIRDLNLELKQMKLPLIKEGIGIGINYGTVVTGNIGDEKRQEFGVIGDTVNIASRLESLCKDLKSRLIISQSTYENLNENLKKDFKKYKNKIELKGKKNKIEIYLLNSKY